MRAEGRIIRVSELWGLTLAVLVAFDVQLVLLLVRAG
jgi:hypothetical protein